MTLLLRKVLVLIVWAFLLKGIPSYFPVFGYGNGIYAPANVVSRVLVGVNSQFRDLNRKPGFFVRLFKRCANFDSGIGMSLRAELSGYVEMTPQRTDFWVILPARLTIGRFLESNEADCRVEHIGFVADHRHAFRQTFGSQEYSNRQYPAAHFCQFYASRGIRSAQWHPLLT